MITSTRHMRIAFPPILLCLHTLMRAQDPVDLHQAFLDLSNDGVLVNISAHPDDEDGATLAYYRMKFGVKTYTVFFTRGEGGQNEIGSDLYEELGALRTVETERAAEILQTKAHFLNLMDFGYSKTAAETFQKWGGRTEVLRRLVYIIRKLKPDVIMTNHNTVGGHGHHQAVAITAIAAFDAAADSTSFPEQLGRPGLAIWQPRKLYFRNFGRTDQSADVVNTIDEKNRVRGESYLDIAARALEMHKSQGMDRADLRRFSRGLSLYKLVRASSAYSRDTTTFFAGIRYWSDPSISDLASLRSDLDRLRSSTPGDSILPSISVLLGEVRRLIDDPVDSPLRQRILRQWSDELEHLAGLICGVKAAFTLQDQTVVSRQKVSCVLDISTEECTLGQVAYEFSLPSGWGIEESEGEIAETSKHSFVRRFVLTVGEHPLLTLPTAVAQYNPIDAEENVGVRIAYTADSRDFSLHRTAQLDVAPPREISVVPRMVRINRQGQKFEYQVRNHFPHKTAGKVWVDCPPGWSCERSEFVIREEDSTGRGSVVVRPPKDLGYGTYTLKFNTEYASDEVILKYFDVAVAEGVTVGIVKSYDNTLEMTCDQLGVHYRLLEEKDLAESDLLAYRTIVVDIRAYLVREDLRRFNARLLEYVRNGGHLVVMYQKDQEWKPEYAPYPMEITRNRVTVEEAPVTPLRPEHPLLSRPNTVREGDWSGWIQERGVYFPDDVSEQYVRLASTNDPDESPLTTGYLVARAGKGSYVYTSFVWYRQLKEANPGAFRCFANMISYPLFKAE